MVVEYQSTDKSDIQEGMKLYFYRKTQLDELAQVNVAPFDEKRSFEDQNSAALIYIVRNS